MGKKLADLGYRTPFFPAVPILGLLINAGVIVGSFFDETTRKGLIAFVPTTLFLLVCYYFFVAKKHKAEDEALLGK